MFRTAVNYLRLAGLVLRYGKFFHSGHDVNAERAKQLQNLSPYVPHRKAGLPLERFFPFRTALLKNSFFRNFIVQGAFIKNSLLPRGAHLHVPFLNIAYIRIPKSASTSLSWAMLQTQYPDLKESKLTPAQINFLTDVNLRHDISNDDSNDVFFTVVRNPLARLVSVYRNFFGQRKNFFLYEDYLFGILPHNIPFAEFVNRIRSIPPWLMDQHLKPQHYFIDIYKKKHNHVIVLKLEKWGEVDSFLSIYSMHIPFINRSAEPYDYRAYYDLKTLHQAYLIYHKDIKLFGYEMEYILLEKSLMEA